MERDESGQVRLVLSHKNTLPTHRTSITMTTYSFTAYKDPSETDWFFDLPEMGITKEALTGGTEEVLDWWFKELSDKAADSSSQLEVTASDEPFSDPTTTAIFMDHFALDPASSWYYDTKAGKDLWFCPVLVEMFGEKPEKLWFKITAVKG